MRNFFWFCVKVFFTLNFFCQEIENISTNEFSSSLLSYFERFSAILSISYERKMNNWKRNSENSKIKIPNSLVYSFLFLQKWEYLRLKDFQVFCSLTTSKEGSNLFSNFPLFHFFLQKKTPFLVQIMDLNYNFEKMNTKGETLQASKFPLHRRKWLV